MANKPFKMKGSPMQRNFGIGESPMKEETTGVGYTGVEIKPEASYDYKSAKIPSFRDMISLEQQQDYAKKVDKRRADEKEFASEIEGAGHGRNIIGKLTGDVFGGKKARDRREFMEKQKEEKGDVAKDWYGVDPKDLEYSSETGQYTPKEGSVSDTHGTWRKGGWNDPTPDSDVTTKLKEGYFNPDLTPKSNIDDI